MAEVHVESNEKREFIIEKCYECYVEKGIENATVRDFCRVTNLNPNTLYYYFRNKEDILFECVSYGYRKLEDAMFEAVDNDSPHDIFTKIRDVWVNFSPEMRFLCQAVSSPTYEGKRWMQFAEVDGFYERFGKKIAQRFECPYDVIRSHIYEIFVLMSYYSLWGSVDMASLQCYKIFQNMLSAVEEYKSKQKP